MPKFFLALVISCTYFVGHLLLVPVAQALPEVSKNIMVSSESPEATRAGLWAARRGGNVVDVAVATHLAMAVSLPQSGSLGGGGFSLIKMGPKVEVLDFRERAPAATSPTFYTSPERIKAKASIDGPLAVGVPGVSMGLYELHKKYGRLKWRTLFTPALNLARGFKISYDMHKTIERNMSRLNTAGRRVLAPRNKALGVGTTLKQPALRRALLELRKHGAKAFYQGNIADDIVSSLASKGGVISRRDLANYKVRWLQPLQAEFQGHRLYLMPPPSSGGIVLASAVKLLKQLNVKRQAYGSATEAHLMSEVLKLAFRGRSLLGDPDYHKNPINYLLSDGYLKPMGRRVSHRRRITNLKPLNKVPRSKESTETTHYIVMDAEGRTVSTTTTLNTNFGSGVFTNKYAISLNNEMDDFSTQPDKPNFFGLIQGKGNQVEPGKRPLSSMSPTIVTDAKGRTTGALGGRGGPRIISAVLQTLYHHLVHGLNAQQALNAPRVHHQFLPDTIFADGRFSCYEVLAGLRRRGHKVDATANGYIGQAFAVFRNPSKRLLESAVDSRGGGLAEGF